MDGLRWDEVLVEHLVKLDSVTNMADKNNNLVELKLIDQVHKLRNFVAFIKAHVVLAQAVQS